MTVFAFAVGVLIGVLFSLVYALGSSFRDGFRR
jgi:hypothetical protein